MRRARHLILVLAVLCMLAPIDGRAAQESLGDTIRKFFSPTPTPTPHRHKAGSKKTGASPSATRAAKPKTKSSPRGSAAESPSSKSAASQNPKQPSPSETPEESA